MAHRSTPRRCLQLALAISTCAWLGSSKASDLNPAAINIKLPDQIKWTGNPEVSETAVLYGDPNKPGLYIVLTKWHPHHMSRPHFHPNDRFITVLSGTWWVGTGSKYDPDSTVAVPAGSFVTHYGKQIHYDGAKDGDAVLEILGEGPATSTPAETK
ncbi:MAG TPA: cupin domain-containing protein [Bryobacteraceae bacterium]|nr:cupin domain-containing protein [Bryobacteraceae bacterium]